MGTNSEICLWRVSYFPIQCMSENCLLDCGVGGSVVAHIGAVFFPGKITHRLLLAAVKSTRCACPTNSWAYPPPNQTAPS
mmetsp:Transcript_59071/g.69054  ORF Transcript_59071/g.69054 Transcript_59071/m.69054 type:complete len:80 (+) Transcript_59071:1232-1471(+)